MARPRELRGRLGVRGVGPESDTTRRRRYALPVALRIPDSAVCLGCGYRLRGLPHPICPECGRSFDLSDAGTYGDTRSGPAWRRFAAPPGAPHSFAALVVLAILLLEQSSPTSVFGVGLLASCAGVGIGLPLLIAYALRLACTLADRARAAEDAEPVEPHRPRTAWLVTPLCLVVVFSAVWLDWPLRTRFALSRRALENEAAHLLAGTFRAWPRTVGLYRVEGGRTVQSQDRVYLYLESWPADRVALVYSPHERVGFDARLPAGWYVYED